MKANDLKIGQTYKATGALSVLLKTDRVVVVSVSQASKRDRMTIFVRHPDRTDVRTASSRDLHEIV